MKNGNLARGGLLGAGMAGCLQNLSQEEVKSADNFLNRPEQAKCLRLGDGKMILHPVAVSRMQRIIEDHGIEAVEIFNKFFYGMPEDGKNHPIDFATARDLVIRAKK